MNYTTVKRHTRVGKNKVSTVRRHARSVAPSKLVSQFKNRYAIKSGVTVTKGDYPDPEGTSMALTESKVSKHSKIPTDHKITLKDKKIKSSGENQDTLVHHELSHILAREKKLKTLPEFKDLITEVRKTPTYKNQVKNDDTYGKDTEEIFARLYSQVNTGDTSSNDYLFNKKELRKLAPLMGKLLTKVSGTKNSIRGTKK
jgi:hypothetical protein